MELVDLYPTRWFRPEDDFRVWRADKGVGTFLTIDLLKSETRANNSGRGEGFGDLRLWIYMTDWRLEQRDRLLLSSSESHEHEYSDALIHLLDRSLLRFDQEAAGLDIQFSDSTTLKVRRNSDEYEADDDLVIVYQSGQPTLGFCSTRGFYEDES